MKHIRPVRTRFGRLLPLALATLVSACAAGAADGLPLFFVPTPNPVAGATAFALRSGEVTVQFASRGVTFQSGSAALSMEFEGAGTARRLEAGELLPGVVNYLFGNSPEDWRTGVRTYASITYRNLYPGIDLDYDVAGGELKSEFRVAAGADPLAIRWRYRGAESVQVDTNGSLIVAVSGGQLRERPPVLFQQNGSNRIPVKGRFRVYRDGSVGFETAAYDRSRALTVDPVLSYSTYLGGSGLDSVKAIAVDSFGNAYVAGYTDSADFPVVSALQPAGKGSVDMFVAKLNAAGTALVYCTYLGGSYDDRAFGIAVDSSGSAYLTGWTYSPNFPVTTGVRQRALSGGRDAFVTKLDAAGSALIYSTYLGGGGNDSASAIAVDASGYAYVSGETYSTNFPASGGYQSANAGRQDAFVAKLSTTAAALVWSTYLGGAGDEAAAALAVDAAGNAFVAGTTGSANFPTYLPLQGTNAGGMDAFATKINAGGTSLGFSTYLGGSGGTVSAGEAATGIALDGAGNVYVAGYTPSANFPVSGAYQASLKGGSLDGFLVKLNPAGGALVYGTYFGGTGLDYVLALAVDAPGTPTVAGYTASSDLPLANALQSAKGGGYDAFAARFTASGAALDFSTYLGGSASDAANTVTTDSSRTLWIAGQTASTGFPTRSPIQSLNLGGYSGFVAKIAERVPAAVFRATNGNTILMRYGSTTLYNALGNVTSAVSGSQNSTGDTYVAGRNDTTCVYMNAFSASSRTWLSGWIRAGCGMYGDPAVAAGPGGSATVVARDASFNYYLSYYTPSAGFGAWVPLGGGFASEPSVAAAANGTVFIVGRSSAGVINAGRYIPGSGFLGWSQAPASITATGKPSVVVGSDGAAYVAVRAQTSNNTCIARLAGDTWGAWMNGGGQAKTDPDLAAAGGTIYAAVTNAYSMVYVQAFPEGTANNWQGWQAVNGTLSNASIAASGGRYFIAGKNSSAGLYWYQSGTGWTFVGSPGLAASEPVANPK